MKNAPIFAIDFEGSKKLGIVEYGVAEIRDWEVVSMRTRICAPKRKIAKKEAEFFDITNARAELEAPFSADLELFCKLRSEGILSAHNAITEDSLLRDALPSPGVVENYAAASDDEKCATWSPWIDTYLLYKNLYGKLDSAKLSDLIGVFSQNEKLDKLAEKFCPSERRKWHCACYDALACALLICRLSEVDGMENANLRWLAKYGGNTDIGQESLI